MICAQDLITFLMEITRGLHLRSSGRVSLKIGGVGPQKNFAAQALRHMRVCAMVALKDPPMRTFARRRRDPRGGVVADSHFQMQYLCQMLLVVNVV